MLWGERKTNSISQFLKIKNYYRCDLNELEE